MQAQSGDARSRSNAGFERLTPRELDCLRALRAYGEAKLAARSLSIGLTTFNEHLAKARKKLGVGRSWEAARLLSEREAAGGETAPFPVPKTRPGLATFEDGAVAPTERERLLTRLGPWAGPALVVLTAAALALAAVMIWATAELALRFQDLK